MLTSTGSGGSEDPAGTVNLPGKVLFRGWAPLVARFLFYPSGMSQKKKSPKAEAPLRSESSEKSKLVRLEDLVPKQDVRAGRRVVFGQVQVETKTSKH